MISIDETKMTDSGTNVLTTIDNDKLIIVIDLKQNHGLSSTGKMTCIGNTGGFTSIDNFKANIYVGKKVK